MLDGNRAVGDVAVHDRVFVKLNSLVSVDVTLNFSSHHDTVSRDVTLHLPSHTNGNRDLVIGRCLNVANDLAINAHRIQQHQAAVNLSRFSNQSVKPLVGGIQRLVFQLFKHHAAVLVMGIIPN